MNGETTRDLLLILVMAVVTFATRLLPFLLFDRGEEPPKAVLYLGRVLPPAIMAMLIVYCLKGVSFATPAGWVPALLSCGAVVLLHLWKGNDLLSIFGRVEPWSALLRLTPDGDSGARRFCFAPQSLLGVRPAHPRGRKEVF